MKYFKNSIIIFSFIFLLPFVAYSAQLSPTAGGGTRTGITYECSNGAAGECTFDDLILAVRKFFNVAIPLALGSTVIVIVYAGYLYMTSGGSPGQRTQANKMFINVAWGIFFMLAAWLIVTLILNSLASTAVPRLLN
jgi:hypothetical protein